MRRSSRANKQGGKSQVAPREVVADLTHGDPLDLQQVPPSSQESLGSNLDDEESKTASPEVESIHDEADDYRLDGDELKEHLKLKTHYYRLTYSEVKGELDFDKYPLTKFTSEHVKNVIRYERAKCKLEKQERDQRDKLAAKGNLLQKRSNAQRGEPGQERKVQKRVRVEDLPSGDHCQLEMARFLLDNLTQYKQETQDKILNHLEDYIKSSDELSTQTQELMIKKCKEEAVKLYDQRDIRSLTQLLSSMSAKNAIVVNVELSKVNEHYSDESNTLQETLLPHLNNTYDYSFLSQEATYTMQRFVKALTNHIIDTSSSVGKGFIIVSLKYEPSRLRKVISYQKNQASLQEALRYLNYPPTLTQQLTKHYQRLLWPNLLDQLKSMTEKTASDCIQIALKLTLISDPGSSVRSLAELFAQRQLLADELLRAPAINIGIQPLIRVLENLLPLSKESITSVLRQDSTLWEASSQKHSNKVEIEELNQHQPDYQEVYKSFTAKLEDAVELQTMVGISKEVSVTTQAYKHCEYQSCMAAVIASHKSPFIIAVAPTGSGKTWVQGLLAKYYCLRGEQVTIIEPSELLKVQTAEKLGVVDYGINIMTVNEFYSYGTKDEVVILDEYDVVVNDAPFIAEDNGLHGLWKLKEKRVVAFTATSSVCHERFVNNCINKPLVLHFKSEYELKSGVTPIQEPKLVNCKDSQELYQLLEQNLEAYYDVKPITIICNKDQCCQVSKVLDDNRYRYAKDATEQTLMRIRSWDRGVLVLEKSVCRGLDTMFQVDSVVFMLAEANNFNELLQMVGRSSRQRNVCESIYFTLNQETSSQLMARLKKRGMDELQTLERLMHLLEKRAMEPTLLQVLKEATKASKSVRSIANLQELMRPTQFNKLMKDLHM